VTTKGRQDKGISVSYVRRFLFACLIAGAGLAGLFAQTPRERTAAQPVDLGQNAIRRMISGQSFVVHTFGLEPFAGPLTTGNDFWTGGAGNWNATTWSLGVMPGSGNNAFITNVGGQVQLNVNDTVAILTIGGGNVLNFVNNSSLTITGNTITNSDSIGSGGITLSSTGNSTSLIIGANVTLTGGGIVTLGNNASNQIYGSSGTQVLTNANNLIQGSGNIGVGQMGLINEATIDANQTTALTIQTSIGTANTGTLEATAGGNLILDGDTYTNTGGTILASGANSIVTLRSPTINGGTLNTTSGGLIQATGNPTLNGVTNSGTYQLPDGQQTTLEGTTTNTSTGIIQLNSAGDNTNLILGGASVTLTGGGTVTLDNNSNNRIYGAVGTDVLTNVNNLIQGSGNVGGGQMGLVNQGTIDANQAVALYIQTTSGTTNIGTLEATAGANLILDGDTYTNTGGTILASGSNSIVTLQSPTINGGTLNTTGGGLIQASGDPTLNGVTNNGTYQVPSGQYTTLLGAITNTGTIEALNGGTVLLSGATVSGGTLTTAGAGVVLAESGSELNGSENTVTNGGDLQVPNNNTLYVIGTVNNTGTITVNSGGGSLVLNGGTFTNSGAGAITAGSGSNVTLEGGVTVSGGTLNGAGLFTSLSGTTLSGLTSAGTVQVPDNNNTTLTGTINNSGSLELSAAGDNTSLYSNGAVTLTGGGTLALSDSNNNYVQAAVSGSSLTNVNNTISGSGNIGNGSLIFTNQAGGVVDAVSANGNSLVINSGAPGATNAGIFEASSGGTLVIESAVANTGGTIEGLAGTGSSAGGNVVIDNGAVVTGGTLNTLGTGVNAGTMSFGGNAILNGVTNNGTITLPNNNSAGLEGTVTNNGSIQVNSFGNGTYLLINGSTTLNGTGAIVLSNSTNNFIYGAAGTEVLTNNGNIIEGAGRIGNGNLGLVNNAGGTILANQPDELFIIANSSGVTNNGTFQVNAGSTLDVTSGPFNNFNSNSGTLTGGTYNVNGGTFQFDYANIVTNAADIILTGASSQIISNTSANALANFATNAAGGVFQLGAGRSFTTSAPGGNFTNDGTLIIGGGDTFEVAGALGNFSGTTLTGGTYYVGGTLQFGTSGSHLVTNDANLTLAGANPELIDLGGNNLLTGFNDNASGGTLTIAAGGSYSTPGSFTNAGTMDTEQGSSLTVSGNLSNTGTVATNLQNLQGGANTFTVTGTLTNSTGATVSIGENSDTSDVANVGLLANSGTVTLGTGATLNLTSAGADTNSGAITADGATLDMQAGSFTNSTGGTLDLEQKGTLTVIGNLTNSGEISTNAANLGGGANTITVTGTLTNNTGASVAIGLNNDTSDGANVGLLANSGTVIVDKGATLNLTSAGTDTNSHDIAVDGGTLDMQAGSFTNATGGALDLEEKGTLTVTGSLTNSGALTTNIANLGGGANTITITGTLTNNSGASVTIGANGDTHDTASVGLLSNAGTVSVDAGATLKLTATGADSNTGAITATGGTLSIASGNAFTNSTGGTLDLESGGKLSVIGNLTNMGALSTNIANLGGAANTISISGKLTNNTGATFTVGANGDTTDTASVGLLGNAGTVAVDKGATFKMTATGADANAGSITATGGTVSIASGGAFTNDTAGTLDLEEGGNLSVTGGLTNAGTLSTNKANLGGAANTIAISGALTNNTGATVIVGDNNDTADTASIGSLANSGTVTVGTGATLEFNTAATDTNAGTIAVNGALDIKLATTLSGAGTLTLTNGAITGLGATGPAFTNSSTIQGSGTISNLGITNAGTLTANQSAALVILPTTAGLDNTGTINVAAGDTMQIGTPAGGALTNFSGTTLTGGTYNVTGTLQFGASGTTIATNAASITLSGAGKMIDFGSNNILAGFKDNSSTGVFKMAAGATLTTTGGSFTNAGTFVAGTGTTFTVGGTSFNFTETGGSAQVNGTLTSSTLGTLAINGGTVDGTGTLGYNVVDSSVLTPGDSATATGKLTVADTYTQQSTGALDIQINGASAGTNYDVLKVTQTATLGGTLNITLGSSFTPSVGETFTILTASSVSDTFATVNGLAINGSEHFTVTYYAGGVVLTVVTGALVTSGPASGVLTRLIPVPVHRGSGREGRYGLGIFEPAAGMGQIATMAHGFGVAHTAAAPTANAPITWPVSFAVQTSGMHGFKPMDQFGAPSLGSAPALAGGISATSAESYNSMGAMNHMRFECGVDLKAALKTSRKKLWKGLWAAPDSPDALYLGYMSYTASH
jgi:hypothetical protein